MDGIVQRQMPLYKSHKEVWALKIAAIEIHEDKSATIAPADDGFATFKTDTGWGERFKGDESDPGYYIVYRDGYRSWSPSKAFEEGYSLVSGKNKSQGGLPNPLQINLGEGRIAIDPFSDGGGAHGLILWDSGEPHEIGEPTSSERKSLHHPREGEIYIRCANKESALVLMEQVCRVIAAFTDDQP